MMYAIDIGNAFSVRYDGANVYSVRSVLAEVPSKNNLRKFTGVLEHNGSLYHVGDAAFRYDLYRMMAIANKQTGSSLADSLVLFLNLISSPLLPNELNVVLQVPETLTSYQHELVKLINGSHTWMLDGIEYKTMVRVRGVYSEGFGSWYMAKRSGLIDYDGYTAVMDLGGGTAIINLLANDSGEVIKSYTHQQKGVVYLANLLCADYDLRLDNNGYIVTVEDIFKGFENETYQIGVNGASFKSYIPRYAKEWWTTLWKTAVNDFQKQFQQRQITKVLVTGGGAEIVRPFVQAAQRKPGWSELFMLSYDPLNDNVKGIFHAYNDNR